MDFQTIVRTLRRGDSSAHPAAVSDLLFLCARAYRHLPPTFDPFVFTTVSDEDSSDNNQSSATENKLSTGMMGSSSSSFDFSRANSATAGAGGAAQSGHITDAELNSLAPELLEALKSWTCPSNTLTHLRRSTYMNTSSAFHSKLAIITVLPLVESAQRWQNAFPPSAHSGDSGFAAEARDAALQQATGLLTANPGAVLQTLVGLASLPHTSRDVNRALLALVRLIPEAAHDEKDKNGNLKPNFWVSVMIAYADSIHQKRSTMSNIAVAFAAQSLLLEVLTRGMINDETIPLFTSGTSFADDSQANKNKKLLFAAWMHLLCNWSSLVFDSSSRRTHKFRDSVGLLASPQAQCNARRCSPLFSLYVKKVAKAILAQDNSFSRFVVAFCSNDDKVVDAVDECLTSTSIPFRSRHHARGRLGVASACIFYDYNESTHKNNNKLSIPFAFLHSLLDTHPGVITEVWPPVACLVSSNSAVTGPAVSFCPPTEAKDIADLIMTRARLLQTNSVVLKDFIVLSQYGASPQQFSGAIREVNECANNSKPFNWDEMFEALVSNSQNISPVVAESLYAPAVASWWINNTSSRTAESEKADLIALAESVSKYFMNKCNSGNEKASVLQTMASVLRVASKSAMEEAAVKGGDDATAAFINCFRAALANPSSVVASAGWLAVSQLPDSFQTNSELASFLKPLASGSGINETQKRICLGFASHACKFEGLHSSLLNDVENGVVVALPDAFLTLGFKDSAARQKLNSKADDDDDNDNNEDSNEVKKWLANPECVVGLIQTALPGQQTAFDPASPTGVAAISPKSFNASNASAQRLIEAHSQTVWSIICRGIEVAKNLATENGVCGPLITFLSAKRGFVRELAARAVLGSARFKVTSQEKKKIQQQQRANSTLSQESASKSAPAATATPAAASVSTSILSNPTNALNAWNFLNSDLLPFLEKKLVEANGGFLFNSNTLLGQAYAESAAANSAAALSTVGNLRPAYAVSLLSRAMMDHISSSSDKNNTNNNNNKINAGETLAAVLASCTHPAVIAASASRNPISTAIDTMFEVPTNRLTGYYRPDSLTPSLRTARGIFGEPVLCSAKASDASRSAGRVVNRYAKLLADNCSEIVQTLCKNLSSSTENLTIEARRTAGRAFAILQAYLDNAEQNITSSCLLSLLKENVKKFESLDLYSKAAMQPDILKSLCKIIDVDLFKKGLLKRHGDRPKGVNAEDWADSCRRESAKADAAREEKLKVIQEKNLATVLERVSTLLIPFGAIRWMSGIKNLVSLDSVANLLSFLMETAFDLRGRTTGEEDDDTVGEISGKMDVIEFKTLAIPADSCDDAAVALLQCTPLSRAASSMVRVYRLLGDDGTIFLGPMAVAESNAFAHSLRLSVTQMLPPELMPPLLLIAKRFFRIYKRRAAKQPSAAAQHQFMSVLATCFGDRNITGKDEAAELLFLIVENFFGLHRMAVNSITSLCAHLSVEESAPLARAVLAGSDLGRESAVQGLDKFANQYGIDSRIGGVLAAAAVYDEKNSVKNVAKNILAATKFQPDESEDWHLVAHLLGDYSYSANAVKVLSKFALEMAEMFKSKNVVSSWLPTILQMPITSAISLIDHLAPVLDNECSVRCLEHLLTIIEDSSSTVTIIRTAAKAGANILGVVPDKVIPSMAEKVKPRLRKSTSSVASHRELHNGANINLLTALATRQDDQAELEGVVDEVVAMSSASSTAYVHRTACDCMFKLAKHPKLRRSDKIVEVGQNTLKTIMNATIYAKKKGQGYVFAGLAAGAGLLYLRKVNFLATVQSAARDRQQQRIAAMILLECCCDIIGEVFEPYSLDLTSVLIDGIGEKDEKISECADDAAKAFMRNLSEAGLHQLIPRLIDALTNENSSKKRAPALNLIGYTAFCSPKQLVATLPSIMRHIIDALCDANAAISRAAYHALKRVAGVVSNSEIKEHVEVLLEAMRNPAHETENALDALLYTRFFTRVDPASLAILAPVILRGLGENNSVIRGKAAQITGSLVKLVSEERSLDAYADDFIGKLQHVVQDPNAGVRSTAAKAMASIAAAISDERVLQVIGWALALLVRANSSAERAGAAEAFCEGVSKGGPTRFAELCDEIEKGLRNENPSTREGFVNIVVYTSSAFPETMFTPLLPTLFQWVLRGLGDSTEQVRTKALEAGSTMITGYGSRTLNFVLEPLVDGISSENSSTRQACLLLTSKLIIHLVQLLRRQYKVKNRIEDNDSEEEDEEGKEKEDGDEDAEEEDPDAPKQNEGVSTEAISAREAERMGGFSVLAGLKEYIGEERFIRIIAALHVARFEHNANVRAEVHNAWTVAVSSIRSAVTSSIQGIVDLCVRFASSDNPECNDLSERILEFTCQRLHETLDIFILSFAKKYDVDDVRHKIGALGSMAEVVPCTDADRLQRLGPHIVSCVLSGSTHEDERVRTNAAAVFDRVSKIAGPKWIDSMVEQQINKSVVGVVELVRVRPVSSLGSVFKTFGNKPDAEIVAHDIRLLRGLVDLEDTRQDLIKHYDRISSMLLAGERLEIPEAAATMTAFAESLVYEYAASPIQDLERALKTPESRAAAIRSCAAFFFGMRAKYSDLLEQLVRMVIHHMADSLPEVRAAAAKALQQMVSAIDSKALSMIADDEQGDNLLVKGACGRYALNFLETVTTSLSAIVQATLNPGETVFEPFANQVVYDTLLTHFFLKYIDHGKAAQKVTSLEGMLLLLSHSEVKSVVASLVGVGGKCVRFLTSKQEGPVLSATMQLVDFLMTINGGGKEVVFENTLAASLCAAMMCDNNEAKIMADTVAIRLVRKNPLNAEKILGGISARKSSIETDVHKTSLSRFVGIVARIAQLEKKVLTLPALWTLIKGYFDSPENMAVAAASGSCLGALCMNVTVADAEIIKLCETALSLAGGKSTQAIGALAFISSVLNNPKSHARITSIYPPFNENAISTVARAIDVCSPDRTITAWTLRAARGAIALNPAPLLGNKKTADGITKVASSLHKSDDMLHGALDFMIRAVPKDSAFFKSINDQYHAPTRICDKVGFYDSDLEDESGSDTRYF